MRLALERDFLKLESSAVASSLLVLWSVMSEVGESTRVGVEVRPEVVKTEE
jgi:hypothetical protein